MSFEIEREFEYDGETYIVEAYATVIEPSRLANITQYPETSDPPEPAEFELENFNVYEINEDGTRSRVDPLWPRNKSLIDHARELALEDAADKEAGL